MNKSRRRVSFKIIHGEHKAILFYFPVEHFADLGDELQPALEDKPHVPFVPGQNLNPNGAKRLYELMRGRRSIRSFSSHPKPDLSVIEDCIRAAGTAPSGAHTEP